MDHDALAEWEYVPSGRVQRLRDAAVGEDESTRAYQGFRHLAYVEGFAAAAGEPLVVRRAAGLARVIIDHPVEIFPDELLVGHHYLGDEGIDFPEMRLAADWRERLAKTRLSFEQRNRILELAETYPVLFAHQRQVIGLPPETQRASARGVHQIWGTTLNHSVRAYDKVLRLGFRGLLAEVDAAIAAVRPEDPEAPARLTFLHAARRVAEAGCILGERYAAEAERLAAGCEDPARAAELREIAEVCRQVPAGPARCYREAVQALWFAHMITCWEDGINANSLGRIDQLLGPYYQREAELGLLDREEAAEWLSLLWIKLYRSYDVQQATVGGLRPDGADATNALSYLALEVTRALDVIRCLSVRVHRGTPRALLTKAARLVARGGGIPFFFNDEALVPALVAAGIPIEDARNYAIIGCIEITIPGRASPHAVSGWLNLAKCLELALNDGCDAETGERLGPPTGRLAQFRCESEVWTAYATQVEHFARQMVFGCNALELEREHTAPLPYLSLLTDDCVMRGLDITAGGARYNYHSCAAVGIPNVADSLAALAELVYAESASITPEDLDRALAAGFAGCEALRQTLLARAPKFGNDDPRVDGRAAAVTHHYCDVLERFRTVRGGPFLAHLFTFTLHLPFGTLTGALPDGRLPGTPLAYSVSPVQGRDQAGLTALIWSLARLPHHRVAASSSAIVELDPAVVAGGGLERFVDLLQVAIAEGVGQLQFNVVSAETLRRAQERPEEYRHLCVRVSGFSQRFCLLGPDMQEHIIARTKHRA